MLFDREGVAGTIDDDDLAALDHTLAEQFEKPGEGHRCRRLHRDAIQLGHHVHGAERLLVAHRLKGAAVLPDDPGQE